MKKALGGYEFHAECTNIRNSTTAIRQSLSRIIEENPGPQTTAMLVAKMAVEISKISDAVKKIEDIGADAKEQRTA